MDDQTERQLAALKDALHEAQAAEQAAFRAMQRADNARIDASATWQKTYTAQKDAKAAVLRFVNEHPEAR